MTEAYTILNHYIRDTKQMQYLNYSEEVIYHNNMEGLEAMGTNTRPVGGAKKYT